MPPGRSINRRDTRFARALPWLFILAVALGAVLRHGMPWWTPHNWSEETEVILKNAGPADVRHPVDVIRTIDGDTFLARVHFPSVPDVTTRVRLRGIDAAELKASCPEELQLAEAATSALGELLRQGGVTIYNIGPDKYQGRVVADVGTARTVNVSAAMLAAGQARPYDGGHRTGWCDNAARGK